jgi:hypothetical protein
MESGGEGVFWFVMRLIVLVRDIPATRPLSPKRRLAVVASVTGSCIIGSCVIGNCEWRACILMWANLTLARSGKTSRTAFATKIQPKCEKQHYNNHDDDKQSQKIAVNPHINMGKLTSGGSHIFLIATCRVANSMICRTSLLTEKEQKSTL